MNPIEKREKRVPGGVSSFIVEHVNKNRVRIYISATRVAMEVTLFCLAFSFREFVRGLLLTL